MEATPLEEHKHTPQDAQSVAMRDVLEVVNDSADDSDASSAEEIEHSIHGNEQLQQVLHARWQQGPSFLRLLHKRRKLIERIVRRMHRRHTEAPVLAGVHSSDRDWVQRNLRCAKLQKLRVGDVVNVARNSGSIDAAVLWCNDTHVEVASADGGFVSVVPRALVRLQHLLTEPSSVTEIAAFAVGDIVEVEARTSPGMNKQGGVGRITKVNSDGTYGVRYHVTGGSERSVEERYIYHWESEGKRRKALGRCRVFGCASLIVDCGHVQPIDELVTKLQNLEKRKPEVRRHEQVDDTNDQPVACSLQALQTAPPQAAPRRRARSKPAQPKRRNAENRRDAWTFAQPSMETVLDMADVFDDEADPDFDARNAVARDAANNADECAAIHVIDLSLLPDDDSRLYKYLKRLDSNNLVAHMKEALKVLQNGTRELEQLKSEASTAFRRRSVSTLYDYEDHFLSLTKDVEQQGWNVFNKCLVICRKRRDLPKRIVATRRRLNSAFEQAFLRFKDNRTAVNHVLKLFHDRYVQDVHDSDYEDTDANYVRMPASTTRYKSARTKRRQTVHQGPRSEQPRQRRPSPQQQRTRPKRPRRVLDESENSDDEETTWDGRPKELVDLTTAEDVSVEEESAPLSDARESFPPPCILLLRSVAACEAMTLKELADMIVFPISDHTIAVRLRDQDVLDAGLCSIHTLCRALSDQELASRTHVAQHLAIIQLSLRQLVRTHNFDGWQSCVNIIVTSLHAHQRYDRGSSSSSAVGETHRHILHGLHLVTLRTLAENRESTEPMLQSTCLEIEKRIVRELVAATTAASADDVAFAALSSIEFADTELRSRIPHMFSHWVQFVHCYCDGDIGAQLVVFELLSPVVGELALAQNSVLTLQNCLNVLAVIAAASTVEAHAGAVRYAAGDMQKHKTYTAYWKLLEAIVTQICESQSLQQVWDLSVALDDFARAWGNVLEAAKLQWKLVVRMAELHIPSGTVLLVGATTAADDEQFLSHLATLHMSDVTFRRQQLLRLVVQCEAPELRAAMASLFSSVETEQSIVSTTTKWYSESVDVSPATRVSTAWQTLFHCAVSGVQRRRLAAALTRVLSTHPTQSAVEQTVFLFGATSLLSALPTEFHDGVAKLVVRLLDASLATRNSLLMWTVLVLLSSSRATLNHATQICGVVTRQLQLVELRQDAIASQDVYAVLLWLQLGLDLAFRTGSMPEKLLMEVVTKCNVLLDHRHALDPRIVYSALSVLEDLSAHAELAIEQSGSHDLFDYLWQRCGKNLLATLSSCLQDLTSFAGLRSKHSSHLAVAVVDIAAQLFTRSYRFDSVGGKYMTCYNDLWLRLRPVAGVQLSQTNIIPYTALGCRFWGVLLDSTRTASFVAARMADVLCAWIQACFLLEMDVLQANTPNEYAGRWSTLASSLHNFVTVSSTHLRGSAFEHLGDESVHPIPRQSSQLTDEKERALVARVAWLSQVCTSLQRYWIENSSQHSKIQHARQIIAQVLQGCERTVAWVKSHVLSRDTRRQGMVDLFVGLSSCILGASLMRPALHILKPVVDQCAVQPLQVSLNADTVEARERQLQPSVHFVCFFPFMVAMLRQIPLPQQHNVSMGPRMHNQWDAWAAPMIHFAMRCMGTKDEALVVGCLAAALAFDFASSVTVVSQLLLLQQPMRSLFRLAGHMMTVAPTVVDPQAVRLCVIRLHVLKQVLMPQSPLRGDATSQAAQAFVGSLITQICIISSRGHGASEEGNVTILPIETEELPMLLVLGLIRIFDTAATRSLQQLREESSALLQVLVASRLGGLRTSRLAELCRCWLEVLKLLVLRDFRSAATRKDLLLAHVARFRSCATATISGSLQLSDLSDAAQRAFQKLHADRGASFDPTTVANELVELEKFVLDVDAQWATWLNAT